MRVETELSMPDESLHFVFAFGMMSDVHTISLYFPLPSQKDGRIFTVIYLAVHWESDSSIFIACFSFSFVNLVLPEYREGFWHLTYRTLCLKYHYHCNKQINPEEFIWKAEIMSLIYMLFLLLVKNSGDEVSSLTLNCLVSVGLWHSPTLTLFKCIFVHLNIKWCPEDSIQQTGLW